MPRRSSLWKNRNFMNLWTGESVSALGSEVSGIAIPLIGALLLHATATEMGLMATFSFAPFLLFGLLAGAWVDRLPRRPILIISNLGRALLLLSIPIAGYLELLQMAQLYVVGFLIGCFTLLFDVAYQSYLPSLVEKDDLADGNGKLQSTRSTASVMGPAIGGFLIERLTAPVTVILDALSFVWSAAWIWSIKKAEDHTEAKAARGPILKEIGEGVRFVARSPLLRPIALATGITNLFSAILYTPYLLYLSRELGLGPGQIGLVYGGGSLGAVLGALIGQRLGTRLGMGRTVLWTAIINSVSVLLIPGSLFLPLPIVWLMVAGFIGGMANVAYNINQVSLRQAYTPGPLQGGLNASMRPLIWGTLPVGALIGGWLGDGLGYWSTMAVAAVGGLVAILPLLFSRVPRVRTLQDLSDALAVGE
jgi:MFS family permease